MRKLATLAVILLLFVGTIISCKPDSLELDENSIELVDKDKNVRPGSQGGNNQTADNDEDIATDDGN